MSSRTRGNAGTWVMFAIPAAVVAVWIAAALVIIAVRPAKKQDETVAITESTAPTPSPEVEALPPDPIESVPPQPAVVEQAPAKKETSPPVKPPTPVATPAPSRPPPVSVATATPVPSPPVTPNPAPVTPPAPEPVEQKQESIDLLSALDLKTSSITGAWKKAGAAIRCDNATAKNRAKLRVAPPPVTGGYDFAITFTAEGERRFVAQVLSFKGKQFIFAMFSRQSGFASVKGQNALGNETTKNKGIVAGKKHTSLVKVREGEISSYLDGELLSTYKTDYSDLELSDAWNLGPTREAMLGLATESPIVVESITLTPLEKQSTTAPAPTAPTTPPTPSAPSFTNLAAMISSPFSTESSAAATQPAATKREINRETLQSLATAPQPAVAEVATSLMQPPPPDAARDALFAAVQLASTPFVLPADPLLDARPPAVSNIVVDRAAFDAEQTRLAAWRKLVARMSELYPNAKPQPDLVKLQFAPVEKGKPASLFATHASAEPLTNVTLAVEIVRAVTSPSPTAFHYYFIPRWEKSQKIFLPLASVPNVSSPELLDSPGASPVNSAPGLMKASVESWSDKLAQPKQEISFDTKIEPLARAQLEDGYRQVDEALRRPAAPAGTPLPAARPNVALVLGPIFPSRPDLDDSAAVFARARSAARRASALLPPQSPLVDDAKAVVDKPLSALRDLRKRQVDAFVEALDVRSTRSGVFVPHQSGTLAKLVKPADRDAALRTAGGNGGKLTMTIDSRLTDGSNFAVTLASAAQPDVKRKFTGRLQVDASNNRLLLTLRPAQAAPAKPADADLKKISNWTSLLLDLRKETLVGIATSGQTDTPTVLNIAFGPGAAAAPPKAK